MSESSQIISVAAPEELSAATRVQFKELCRKELERRPAVLRIDCSELGVADSVGLGALLVVINEAREVGTIVVMDHVMGPIHTILDLTRLSEAVYIREGGDANDDWDAPLKIVQS